MRIRTQLWAAGFGAAVVGVAVVLGLLHVTRLSAEATRAQADTQEVAREVTGLLALTLEYTLYGGQRPSDQWRARHAQLARTVDAALARSSPPHDSLLALRQSFEPLTALFDRLDELDTTDDGALAERRKQFLIERLLTEMQEVAEARQRWATAVGDAQAREQRLYTTMVLTAPALLLLLIGGLAAAVGRRVLGPLARLQATADAVRAGHDPVGPASTADDELGDMARAFDTMTASLRQQSAAREASERHLRLVIDNVPGLIGFIDTQGCYTFCNQAYVSWHDRPVEQIIGQTVHSMYEEPENRAAFEQPLERALAGEAVEFESEMVRHGRDWVFRVNFIPQFDAAGQVSGVYAMSSDITPLKRVERQLRTTMDASPLGMFHVDALGRCLYVNPAWLRISGLTVEESLGWGGINAVHPDDRPLIAGLMELARQSGDVHATEHRYLRPDGSVVWARAHGVALRQGGQTVGFVGTVEDITERRALDATLAARTDELARSNAELEQFAYVASHDLQEPLRMVTSYTQLLLRRHGDKLDGDAHEFLGFIDDGGRRAQALINDLLSLARVNSQGKPFEPVAVQGVLDEVLQGLKLLLQDSGAQLTHDEPLPTVSADRRQLGQLLQNLIANALKFRGDDAPRVHVGARREADGRWRISVADNGIGIEPRFHQRVFVMFQRLHLRSDYAGTGIGLAICKKVVERHGGQIGVESAPGRGSTFWFTLADAGRRVEPFERAAPARREEAGR